jgi:enoyl-CoA hydratase/carnithine racemase
MPEPALLYEKKDGVAVLTMNRPEVRNAMNAEMLCRLADAWQEVVDDATIRCAILTGTGDQAFCAGADLGDFIPVMMGTKPPKNEWDERAKGDPGIIYKGLLRGFDVVKPIIAAVNGHSYAGGTEILQATDIRVAAKDVRFAISEVKRSLFPMGGSTVRLVRQIPWALAMEILLTGEPISADEAWRIGLINKVVPREKVLAEAMRYAAVIAENGPLAVQAVKQSVLAGSGLSIAEALQKEMEIGIPVTASEDAREGPRAFKEKRKAVYKGR